MKRTTFLLLTVLWMGQAPAQNLQPKSGYATVNGLKMYYERYGKGRPLVLLHGGGSTIQTTFARLIPYLAKDREIIAVELQAHGRTEDRNAELSFEQDADDVAALMRQLQIAQADFLGFSNGGSTVMQLAIRHPAIVGKIIIGSTMSKRSGVPPEFWGFMENATFGQMPQPYKDAYLEVAPHPEKLQDMAAKCARRMVNFKDIPDDSLRKIKANALIVSGDRDVPTTEHCAEIHRLIPGSRLAILPGGHGEYLGEITTGAREEKVSAFAGLLLEFLSGK